MIRRCPDCVGPKAFGEPCDSCKGSRYLHEDGTPATAQEMLDQITGNYKPRPLARPTKFPRSRR